MASPPSASICIPPERVTSFNIVPLGTFIPLSALGALVDVIFLTLAKPAATAAPAAKAPSTGPTIVIPC